MMPIFPARNLFTNLFLLAIVDFYAGPFLHVPNHSHHASYDFIIIGGGTGGAIVASRLSADPKFNILLIEQGETPGNYYSEIPYYSQRFGFISSPLLRDYVSERQAHAPVSMIAERGAKFIMRKYSRDEIKRQLL